MKKLLQVVAAAILMVLFLAAPLFSSQIQRAGGCGNPHPAVYYYNYRYYRPQHVQVEDGTGSRQCYWYYANGSYLYVCR